MSESPAPFPEVQAILDRMRGAPTMNQLGLAVARENATKRTTNPPKEEVAAVEEHLVEGPAGEVRVRLYRPSVGEVLPLVIYLHAGGWILGDLEHSDHLCRRLANRSGAAVMNVDYRLAPEHQYPAPLDDCESALDWAFHHAASLGIDVGRIAVAGESSGGNLAAALALRVSRLNLPRLRFVLLLEPALDSTMDTASWEELGRYGPPAREQMRWMWDLYLANVEDARDPEASPLAAKEFAGHPQTLIVGAEFDPLRDEARLYAEKLKQAGVNVEWRLERGLMHAFSNLGGVVPQGLEAFDRAVLTMKNSLTI